MNLLMIGGGTNSIAMVLEMHKRKIPIDICIFADTKAEKPKTYESLNELNEWLINNGYQKIVIVTTEKSLEEDCITRKALPSIAYGFKSCSQRFKIAPQEKFCNNYQPFKEIWKSGGKITKFIGYDATEQRRADNANRRNKDDKKYNYRYPLIEFGINREMCEKIIFEYGFKQPGKSSCFFCPNMKKEEILILKKENPDLLKKALEIEKNADLYKIAGLGRNYAWSDYIYLIENQIDLFNEIDKQIEDTESEYPCECIE